MKTITQPNELLQRITAIEAAPQGQTILFVEGKTPLGSERLQIVMGRDNTRVDYRAPGAPLGNFTLEWMLNESVGHRVAARFREMVKLGAKPREAREALTREAEKLTRHHHAN